MLPVCSPERFDRHLNQKQPHLAAQSYPREWFVLVTGSTRLVKLCNCTNHTTAFANTAQGGSRWSVLIPASHNDVTQKGSCDNPPLSLALRNAHVPARCHKP
ncbi:hypothetical protein BD779DRAFT_316482 [Infundibulicybe gibba]|nr:hypothetical protein BD779DRAFT_316482 [Infundibulicybe gibba]